jgi:hypothetical protein
MFDNDTRQNLLRVLEDLKKDLKKKDDQLQEFEAIRSERNRIIALIHHIQEELGIEEPQNPPMLLKTVITAASATSEAQLSIITEKPIKKGISEIFDEFHRPMHVNEIVVEFRKRGWKLSENHPQEVIRGALKRNPKLFKKVSRGNWDKIRRVAQVGPSPSLGDERK